MKIHLSYSICYMINFNNIKQGNINSSILYFAITPLDTSTIYLSTTHTLEMCFYCDPVPDRAVWEQCL